MALKTSKYLPAYIYATEHDRKNYITNYYDNLIKSATNPGMKQKYLEKMQSELESVSGPELKLINNMYLGKYINSLYKVIDGKLTWVWSKIPNTCGTDTSNFTRGTSIKLKRATKKGTTRTTFLYDVPYNMWLFIACKYHKNDCMCKILVNDTIVAADSDNSSEYKRHKYAFVKVSKDDKIYSNANYADCGGHAWVFFLGDWSYNIWIGNKCHSSTVKLLKDKDLSSTIIMSQSDSNPNDDTTCESFNIKDILPL